MGTTYLLDTNTVIYYLEGLLPEKAMDFIEQNLNETGSFISIISKVELLGWQAPQPNTLKQIQLFINDSEVIVRRGAARTLRHIRAAQQARPPENQSKSSSRC